MRKSGWHLASQYGRAPAPGGRGAARAAHLTQRRSIDALKRECGIPDTPLPMRYFGLCGYCVLSFHIGSAFLPEVPRPAANSGTRCRDSSCFDEVKGCSRERVQSFAGARTGIGVHPRDFMFQFPILSY